MGANNNVSLEGKIISEPTFDHQVKQRKMYSFNLAVFRSKHGQGYEADIIPIVASDNVLKKSLVQAIPFTEDISGRYVVIQGEFRSKRMPDSSNRKFVYAFDVEDANNCAYSAFANTVDLTGQIIKKPYTKQTANGATKCTSLLSVKREHGNLSDYISIVAWNKCAEYLAQAKANDTVHVIGEIRQRTLTDAITGKEEILYEIRAKKVEVSHETGTD